MCLSGQLLIIPTELLPSSPSEGPLLKGHSAYVVRLLITNSLLKTPGIGSQSTEEYIKIGEGILQSLNLCTPV